MYCGERNPALSGVLRKTFIILIAVMLIVPIMSVKAFAVSPLSVEGGENVKGGDTFTMVITFGGDSIGRVDAQLTYDTGKLSYISGGSSTGNTGYVELRKAGTDGSVTFNVKFQALEEGNATIEVETNELYDLNEVYLSGDTPSVSKVVSISGSAAAEEVITEEGPTEETVPSTELVGVDEKTDEEEPSNMNIILIIAAAVLVALIVVVSIILAKKKKKNKKGGAVSYEHRDDRYDDRDYGDDTRYYDRDDRYYDDRRYDDRRYDDEYYGDRRYDDRQYDGRRYDDRRYDDRQYDDRRYDDRYYDDRYDDADARAARREQNRNIRKRASEETELWDDWNDPGNRRR